MAQTAACLAEATITVVSLPTPGKQENLTYPGSRQAGVLGDLRRQLERLFVIIQLRCLPQDISTAVLQHDPEHSGKGLKIVCIMALHLLVS